MIDKLIMGGVSGLFMVALMASATFGMSVTMGAHAATNESVTLAGAEENISTAFDKTERAVRQNLSDSQEIAFFVMLGLSFDVSKAYARTGLRLGYAFPEYARVITWAPYILLGLTGLYYKREAIRRAVARARQWIRRKF